MEITIPTKFCMGQLVYSRCCADWAGVVTGLSIRPAEVGYSIAYLVMWSDHEEQAHYENELLDEKPTFET